MKKLLLFVSMFTYSTLCAQNIVIQQNNQPYQREKVIIQEKKVPVYVQPQSTELTEPVLIQGYLYVYPIDLGKFTIEEFPYQVRQSINRSNAYGRNNWRLPTESEYKIMEEVNGGFDNKSGKLRLKGRDYDRWGGGYLQYMTQDSYGRPKKVIINGRESAQLIRLVSTR